MSSKRRAHTPAFKAEVALEALRAQETTAELSKRFQVHPNQIYKWRRQLVERASGAFSPGEAAPCTSSREEELLREIRARTAEWECLVAGARALPAELKRQMVGPSASGPSIRRQCALLGVSRSSVYYQPVGVDPEELELMRAIDELHLHRPDYGSRRVLAVLREQGRTVNRKRVQRLMQRLIAGSEPTA